MNLQNLRGLGLVFVVGAVLSCSSTDETVGPPQGPSDLGIAKLSTPSLSALVTKSGATLQLDCTHSLWVTPTPEVSDKLLGSFLLATPLSCGADVNCGTLVVVVDPRSGTENQYDALDASGVPRSPGALVVRSLTSPIVVDLPPKLRTGKHTFRLELHDSSDGRVLDANGKLLSASFVVTLRDSSSPCTPSGGETGGTSTGGTSTGGTSTGGTSTGGTSTGGTSTGGTSTGGTSTGGTSTGGTSTGGTSTGGTSTGGTSTGGTSTGGTSTGGTSTGGTSTGGISPV